MSVYTNSERRLLRAIAVALGIMGLIVIAWWALVGYLLLRN